MENFEKTEVKNSKVNHFNAKGILLSLALALGSSNFSYAQTNGGGRYQERTEQQYEAAEKTFAKYSELIVNRNKDIVENTSEDLEKYEMRMKNQFVYETTKNSSIIQRISTIKDILNSKYSQNITKDDPLFVLQSAFRVLSKSDKYRGLDTYTDKFSNEVDMNFVNALGFTQYMNGLSCNRNLSYGGTTTLDKIISDLEYVTIGNTANYPKNNIKPEGESSGSQSISQPPKEVKKPAQNDGKGNTGANTVSNTKPDPTVTSKPSQNTVKPNVTPNNEASQRINILSNNLSSDKLDGVTYEEVWNSVNLIKHDGLKNAVMSCLLRNDVVGAQRLMGMDINCDKKKYPDYVASQTLGKRELALIEKYGQTRRLMDYGEVVNFMTMIENAYEIDNYDVKTAYLKFLSGEINNGGLPYCIISKYDYKMYLFSADHKLLSCHPVLTGADIGNNKNDPLNGSQTTPGGSYKIGGVFDKSLTGKDLLSVYGTDYLLLLPLEGQYTYSDKYTMGLHGYTKGRENRFESPNSRDHRITNGCINGDREIFGEIVNHLKVGSIVYICRDDLK